MDRLVLAACLAVLGFSICYPTLRMVGQAVWDWQWDALTLPGGYRAIRNTVVISVLTVLTSGVVGTALAFALNRFTFPGQRVASAMAYLPFALPPLVGVLSFYYLIGRDGFLPRMLAEGFGIRGVFLRGGPAILLVHTYSFYVYFYAMVSAALEGMDASVFEAARTLGASRFRVFTRVTLPLLRPALVGASLLTFMSSGASFSAPYIFGEGFSMLSVRIVEARRQFEHGDAYTLTVVLALVGLAGVLAFRAGRPTTAGGAKGAPTPVRSRSGRFLATGCAAVGAVVLLAPHLTILWLSFVDHSVWNEEVIPPAWTLTNYLDIVRHADKLRPIWNSVWMSGLAAAVTLAVALPAGYLIGRRRPGSAWVNVIVMIPWALPGTVIAMNLIVAFNDPWLPLYGTIWILPFGYYVRSVPLLTRMASAAIEPFDATLIEAGRTLGASRFYCFRRIVAPLLAPALVAGTALVFATSLGEFVASVLLYFSANIPISMQIYNEWRGSGIGSAFAYSVFLMALVAATFMIARRFAVRTL